MNAGSEVIGLELAEEAGGSSNIFERLITIGEGIPLQEAVGSTCIGDELSADYAYSTIAVPRTCWVEGESIRPIALTDAKNGIGFFQSILRKVEAQETSW